MRIVLIGAPGSGKGTQGALLSEFMALPYLGLGDIMREEVRAGTERGAVLKSHMDAGTLAPDELATDIVQHAIAANTAGFVLDGYPRTIAQATSLDDFLASHAADIDAVVVFRVDEEVLVSRLSARGRSDDAVDVVRARLAIYHSSAQDLIDHYHGRILELDAVGEVDEVRERLVDALREHVDAIG